MDYLTLDDQTLIRLIAHVDENALSALYDRYNRMVFSLALQIIRDHGTAEEITLDVFTRIWEKANTYRTEQAKVSTWLTSITRHRAIDELRRRDARRERHVVEWSELSLPVSSQSNSPESTTERIIQQERVRADLRDLGHRFCGLRAFNGRIHR